jgi:chromosome segregation ATPase
MIENPNNTDLTNQAMQEDLNRHKEENMRLQSKLKEEEIEQAAAGNKLMDTNAARKNLELEGDALNSNLGQKLRLMDDLSKERVIVLSDLHQANNELERLNRQHLSMNHENIDMETHIQRL